MIRPDEIVEEVFGILLSITLVFHLTDISGEIAN